MCIGPGVTFGKLKFVGYNCQESIPQKMDLLWCSSGCPTGGGEYTAYLLLNGKRGVMNKNLLACFLQRWEEENGEKKINSVSERVGKHPLPCLLRQDCLGKGKEWFAGCVVSGGVVLEKKNLVSFLLLPCQVRERKYSKRTAASQLYMASAHQYSAILFLHCLSSLHAGKAKVASISYSNKVKNS